MRRSRALLAAAVVAGAAHAAPAAAVTTVRSGDARFEVLTPTLIRAEYSLGGDFEDRPTETAINRDQPDVHVTVTRSLGMLTIDTGPVKLHYIEGSPLFTPATLTADIDIGGMKTTARPTWDACQQLDAACDPIGGLPGTVGIDPTVIGGYAREAIDVDGIFPPLHAGLLRTTGSFLLDDTSTAVLTSPTTAIARPLHVGNYQDGYLFAYGHDYPQALSDLRTLAGAAPLLPRWTFGPWFSRYYPYSAADYKTKIVPAFRAHDTPLDGLVVDTDAKGPDRWNGWGFNSTRFPDPKGFLDWTRAQGLHVVFNIHPSIDNNDPAFAAVQASAQGRLQTGTGTCQFYRSDPPCYVFDWGDPVQASAYFRAHKTFEDAGIQNFWLDWCCDASTVSTRGLSPDGWINGLYAAHQRALGGRGFVLSRLGSGVFALNGYLGDILAPASGPWADHRSTIPFTGDATSAFKTLAYEAMMTPAEGAATGTPYLSHDIGGYTGDHLPDDLYLRWVQMGTFSPILRLHSDHGERLPWDYKGAAEADAERFLRLREELVPYLYDTAEEAHESGLPMARLLALEWPALTAVKDEWMLGDSLLFAPITTPGTSASRSVVLPPGHWTDFFTGRTVDGPATITATAGLDRAPVWIKAGAIVPMSAPLRHVGRVDPLTLRVARGASGDSSLYEDAGDGLGYESGAATRQALRYTESGQAGSVRIGAARGPGPGAPKQRSYVIQVLDVSAPAHVRADGHTIARKPGGGAIDLAVTTRNAPAGDRFRYDKATRTLTIRLHRRSTRRAVSVSWR